MSKLNLTRSKILTQVYKHFGVSKKALKQLTEKGIEWHAGEIQFTIPLHQLTDGTYRDITLGESNVIDSPYTLSAKAFKKTKAYAEYLIAAASLSDMEGYCFMSKGSRAIFVIQEQYEGYYGGSGGIFFKELGLSITTLENYLQDMHPVDHETE